MKTLPENLRQICDGERTDLTPEQRAAYASVCAKHGRRTQWDVTQPSRGLGDTIAKFASATGLDKAADYVAKKLGRKGCGCKGRQEKLNEAVPYAPPALPVSVAIISHNYGRYLQDAIDSARQDNPAEIVVIDDASTDNTRQVAESAGVRYLRHDARNVHESRKLAFAQTKGKYLCFLDADDKLKPGYLAKAVAEMEAAGAVGIVHSDFEYFGGTSGSKILTSNNIEHYNYIHAGSVVRRAALETSGAMDRVFPMPGVTHDWVMWRDIIRAGWGVAKNAEPYLYRKHGESMTRGDGDVCYRHRAMLDQETVTIVIPLSGRDTSHLWAWLLNQTWPHEQTRLLLVDTVPGNNSGEQLLKGLPYRNKSLLQVPVGRKGLADENRLEPTVNRDVRSAVASLYARLRNEVNTEYCLIVEDDIEPPPDAINRLFGAMDERTASVAGLALSRYADAYLHWGKSGALASRPGRGVEAVGGTGFHCTLIRRSVWRESPMTSDGFNGEYDREFGRWCNAKGYAIKVDWSVKCAHGLGKDRKVIAEKMK